MTECKTLSFADGTVGTREVDLAGSASARPRRSSARRS